MEYGAEAFEVRCYGCNASFAPGTKRCVHCGERLGGAPTLIAGEAVELPEGTTVDPDDEIELGKGFRGRSILWALMAVVAMVVSMLRQCAERGG